MKSFFDNAFAKNKTSAIFYLLTIIFLSVSLILGLAFHNDATYGASRTVSGFEVCMLISSIVFFMELASEVNPLFKVLRKILYILLAIFSIAETVSMIHSLLDSLSAGEVLRLLGYALIAISTLFLIIIENKTLTTNQLKFFIFVVCMFGSLFLFIGGIVSLASLRSSSAFFNFLFGTAIPTFFYLAIAFEEKLLTFLQNDNNERKALKTTSNKTPSVEDKILALKLKLELETITKVEYDEQLQDLLRNL